MCGWVKFKYTCGHIVNAYTSTEEACTSVKENGPEAECNETWLIYEEEQPRICRTCYFKSIGEDEMVSCGEVQPETGNQVPSAEKEEKKDDETKTDNKEDGKEGEKKGDAKGEKTEEEIDRAKQLYSFYWNKKAG